MVHDGTAMSSNAELSSVSSRLHELIGRITEIAGGLGSEDHEGLGTELFEVERALRSAQRRLDRLIGR